MQKFYQYKQWFEKPIMCFWGPEGKAIFPILNKKDHNVLDEINALPRYLVWLIENGFLYS